MATYQILSWHGIPVQVRARDASGRASVQLPSRFQEAIDAAAMAAKQISSDAYTDGFEWSARQDREGSAQAVAEVVAAELDARYPEIDWRTLAASLSKTNP